MSDLFHNNKSQVLIVIEESVKRFISLFIGLGLASTLHCAQPVAAISPDQYADSFTLGAEFEQSVTGNANGTDEDDIIANDYGHDSPEVDDGIAFVYRDTNSPPVAVDDIYSVGVGSTLAIQVTQGVLQNDSDVEGDSLIVILVEDVRNGSLALTNDGSFIYVPNAGFVGIDTFVYEASDGIALSNSAVVSISINDGNSPPLAFADMYNIDEDQTSTFSIMEGVLHNDYHQDGGDPLMAVLVQDVDVGILNLRNSGSFTYIPESNFFGTVIFTYKAVDGDAESDEVTVTINVNPINDVPQALDDGYIVDSSDVLIVDATHGVLANDIDVEEDALVVLKDIGVVSGTLELLADGSFSYVPNIDFEGVDRFTYKANDGTANSEIAMVTITVEKHNTSPVVVEDAYEVDADDTLQVDAPGVLDNDADDDVGDLLKAVLVSDVVHGTLTLEEDGSFIYVPDAGFSGDDAFTYKASDDIDDSNEVMVVITVNLVSDLPIAVDDFYRCSEDITLDLKGDGVLSNDYGIKGVSLAAVLVKNVSHGSLTLRSDGSFTYTPKKDFNGIDMFTYLARAAELTSDECTVTIVVNPVDDQPMVQDDFYTMKASGAAVLAPGVLRNDSEVDGEAVTVTLVRDVAQGVLSFHSDGSFSYLPNDGFEGTDSFTYKASDGKSESGVATVVISVELGDENDDVVSEDTDSSEKPVRNIWGMLGISFGLILVIGITVLALMRMGIIKRSSTY
ncbi:MAG: Ig-like domain-containing protein [Chloroflexota bacterium]|nr:Ig-like domain-containing protein [Chloroflexota bacterium]